MKSQQKLPQVIKLLPQPFEFDNGRKSVEFTFINENVGTYEITDFVTTKKSRGRFTFIESESNVNLLTSGLAILRKLFSFRMPCKRFEEA